MDETIRDLQRKLAASGSAEDEEALERALERLGRESLRFTGPLPPPEQGHRGPRQIDRAESTAADCWIWSGQPDTRRQAKARRFTKQRRRRALRRVRKAACRDWDLWA